MVCQCVCVCVCVYVCVPIHIIPFFSSLHPPNILASPPAYYIIFFSRWPLYPSQFPLYTTLLQLTTTSIDSYGFLVFLVIVAPASTLIIYFRSRSPVLISKNSPADTREFSDDSCHMEELVKVDFSLVQQPQ